MYIHYTMTSLKFPPVQELQIFVVQYNDVMSKLGLQTRRVSKTIDVLTESTHSMVKGNLNKIEKNKTKTTPNEIL